MNESRQSRSFTLSHPPASKLRIKRSKTYTGCWTCRERGIKCDEKRPACMRCLRSSVCCEGYDIKLAWDGDHGEDGKPVKRRTFLAPQNGADLALGSREIHLALAKIDDVPQTRVTVQAGPFAVFPVSELPETPNNDADGTKTDVYDQDHISSAEVSDLRECDAEDIERQGHDRSEDPVVAQCLEKVDRQDHDGDESSMAMMSIKRKILPRISTYLSCATKEERSLFHYWVTFLSGLMIPTQNQDNPFRTIFIPLALGAATSPQESSGNVALLHSIYAVSAFHRAQLSPSDDEHFLALGEKHQKMALGHLRQNLMQPDDSQKEAVLATIITMSSIDVIKGESSSWRIHLAGGSTWLQHMERNGSTQSASTSVLGQIFFCINVLGHSLPQLMDKVEFSLGVPHDAAGLMHLWDETYVLDKLFGITKPVLMGIATTNTVSNPAYEATNEEIEGLDQFIRRNDPDVMLSDLNERYDAITRHHTCAFFCASLIYFERRVRKTSPRWIQRMVQRSLDHLEAIATLETQQQLDVCGLFWPEFVTACEAEAVCDLRDRALRMFAKGRLLGIGNIIAARTVVQEVWRRRDNDPHGSDVAWQDVMADLELDILLM
ncbi:fungal-specific transcription factor domain-containing protein [Xylariales sp. AK1849]|nr:fungal-specific transcription factor domain-containing protein [Xylariales sp. AK1849]